MTSQYRCQTCKHYLKHAIACNKIKERLIVGADEWVDKVGCASHSDFQSERERVLDTFLAEMRAEMQSPFEYIDWDSVEAVYIRLRSKGGE